VKNLRIVLQWNPHAIAVVNVMSQESLPPMQAQDAELVELSKSGDRSAYETLYRRHVRGVYGLARRLVGTAEDAEDLTEETFVRAWSRLGSLRDGGAFRTWLFRIAVRQAQDLRKRRNLPTTDLANAGPVEAQAEGRVLTGERAEAVQAAVETLSPEHRDVVKLFYRDEMPVEEIGRLLGVPKGTVVSRLSRARAALKEALAEYIQPAKEVTCDAL
jgi:RNA polymerase sigma-70 factor, ECF subfamily